MNGETPAVHRGPKDRADQRDRSQPSTEVGDRCVAAGEPAPSAIEDLVSGADGWWRFIDWNAINAHPDEIARSPEWDDPNPGLDLGGGPPRCCASTTFVRGSRMCGPCWATVVLGLGERERPA